MRILFICHRFPFPPDHGGKVRSFNLIRSLGRKHELTVASLIRSSSELRAVSDLQVDNTRVLTARVGAVSSTGRMLARLPTRSPLSFGYFHSPRLARKIQEEMKRTRYDVIFVHCSSAAPYVDGSALPKILDFGDMDSEKWMSFAATKPLPESLIYRLEGRRLRREEAALAARFDACTCTTAAEVGALRGMGFTGTAECLPNGVDSEYFQPSAQPYESHRLCFLGRMDYYPNEESMVHFCTEILPLVRARRADVHVTIVGAQPSRRVRALGRMPGITVTGGVPDVRPYACRSALSVAPLRIARGTQNKILESLAMGVPVVCSSLAARGVDVIPGTHLLTADSPRDFAATILHLMNDAQERQRLAVSGRARVLSHHRWEDSARKLEELMIRCVEGRSRNQPAGTIS